MKSVDKLNNAIKALDSDFYQLKFYPSEKVEGTKQFSKEELDEYAKALLKKYGDKRVVITQMGKVYKTFKTLDASRGHEVVVYANQALREMGKNNSVGKYDRVVMGARSTLGESLLPSDELKKVVKREVERLLKKYNLD